MKRITHLLTILLIFSCVGFLSENIYADSGESSSLKLPQGVKLADEETSAADPIKDAASETLQEKAGTDSAGSLQAGEQSDVFQVLDAPEGISSSESEGGGELSRREKGLAELRAYVDKSSITIGEKVTYTLEIDADNNLEVEFPSYVSGLGGFAVKDFGEDYKKIGRHRSRRKQWYLLDTYTIGSYVIPEQSVKVKLSNGQIQVLKSPQIFVEVKSVMDNEKEKAGLRDIKEPLAISAGTPLVLVIAVVLIILAAGGIILWKFYLKKFSVKKMEPALTPQEIAFRELERIEGLELIEKMKIKEYYYLVSLALRTYLEDRFSLKAPEQTTEEFLESLVRSDKLEGKYINMLKEYLNHCDLVKYAKFDPGKSQGKKLIETTRHFIKETSESNEGNSDETANEAKT